MKVVIAIYDGHVNSSGFRSWEEARRFVISRISENAYIQRFDNPYWTTLKYYDEEEKKIHTWELNEVELVKLGSS